MNENVCEAVEEAKDKLKRARALIQAAISELRAHGKEKLDRADPYSQDLEDVRDVMFNADDSVEIAIGALNGFKKEAE